MLFTSFFRDALYLYPNAWSSCLCLTPISLTSKSNFWFLYFISNFLRQRNDRNWLAGHNLTKVVKNYLELRFSTCGFWTFCVVTGPFYRSHWRQTKTQDIYVTIHSSCKFSYEVSKKIILWLGLTTQGTVLRFHNIRKVGNHCSTE